MNNLPMKKEKGIISKIKKFFKRLFYSDKKMTIVETTDENNKTNELTVENESFINDIKTKIPDKIFKEIQEEIQMENERENFISEINKNPKILDDLSFERLEKLNEFCDVVLNKYIDKLNNITSN